MFHLLIRSVNTRQMGLNSKGGGSSWWREPFQILTTLLLSLLLPLSFLLLARLSAAHYLASSSIPSTAEPYPNITTFLSFIFLYNSNTNSIILVFLYSIVSVVSVAALVHALSGGRMTFSSEPVSRPRLYAAWILLCTLQLCVGLGIEGSIDAGVDGSGLGSRSRWWSTCRLMLLVGLHETMQFWSKSVVKPVVDDTVMGFVKEDGRIERIALGLSLGTLWLWGLRDEIDSLVVAEYVYVGRWLYYLTVSIGIIRVLKGGIWLGMLLFFSRKPETHLTPFHAHPTIEDKV